MYNAVHSTVERCLPGGVTCVTVRSKSITVRVRIVFVRAFQISVTRYDFNVNPNKFVYRQRSKCSPSVLGDTIESRARDITIIFTEETLQVEIFGIMCAKMAFQHQAGTAMECLSIPITLHKETEVNENGENVMKCGFKIGGGIDQDFRKSPQGYTDNGIYVTEVHEGSPAAKSGLRMHDKILQCNGYDFTMVTHKKAVSYIKKHPVLNLLVARKGVTST